MIAQRAAQHEQRRKRQQIGVDDPLDAGYIGVEIGLYGRQRHADGVPHEDGAAGQHGGRQHPASPGGAKRALRGDDGIHIRARAGHLLRRSVRAENAELVAFRVREVGHVAHPGDGRFRPQDFTAAWT